MCQRRQNLLSTSSWFLIPSLVRNSGVLKLTTSDHYAVYTTLNLRVPKAKATYISTRSYKSYNAEKFSADVSVIPWTILDLMDTCDEMLHAFNDLFLTCLNSHAPVKTVRLKRKPNPFITDQIKQLIATRNILRKQAHRSRLPTDLNAFIRQRKMVNAAIRKAEIEYYTEQIHSNKGSSRSMWKTIRQAPPKKTKPLPAIHQGNQCPC